ncbi:MAG: hypothetical protein WAQ47_13055 [Methanosarcina flavescens]
MSSSNFLGNISKHSRGIKRGKASPKKGIGNLKNNSSIKLKRKGKNRYEPGGLHVTEELSF